MSSRLEGFTRFEFQLSPTGSIGPFGKKNARYFLEPDTLLVALKMKQACCDDNYEVFQLTVNSSPINTLHEQITNNEPKCNNAFFLCAEGAEKNQDTEVNVEFDRKGTILLHRE